MFLIKRKVKKIVNHKKCKKINKKVEKKRKISYNQYR